VSWAHSLVEGSGHLTAAVVRGGCRRSERDKDRLVEPGEVGGGLALDETDARGRHVCQMLLRMIPLAVFETE
jgi:hypothetical protein